MALAGFLAAGLVMQGHAKVSLTLDIYADSIPANVDAAMERLGAML